LPGICQIPTELIRAGGDALHSEFHKFINTICKGRINHSSWILLLLFIFINRVIKLTVVIIEGYHCWHLHTNLSAVLLLRLTPYVEKTIGDHQCEFQSNKSTTDHICWICLILVKKMGIHGTACWSFIDFQKAY